MSLSTNIFTKMSPCGQIIMILFAVYLEVDLSTLFRAPTPPMATSAQSVTMIATTTSQATPMQNSGSMNNTILIIAVTISVVVILVIAAGIPVLILCIKRKSKTLVISK